MSARSRNRFVRGAFPRPSGEPPNAKLRIMSMFKKLVGAFEMTPSPPTHSKEERDEVARSVVQDCSHGNIFLQDGRYYTKEDIEKEFEQSRKFDFEPGPKDRPRK